MAAVAMHPSGRSICTDSMSLTLQMLATLVERLAALCPLRIRTFNLPAISPQKKLLQVR